MSSFHVRTRRGAGGFGLILFMISMIIFASGAVVVYTVFFKPENILTVPSFKDKSVVEAVYEAERLGLVVQVEQVASTLPDGRVLAQSPNAGSAIRKGNVVVLQVAKGGELHPVPDVSGKTLAEAQEEIKAQGFAMGDVVRIREAGREAGSVIAQSPAAPADIASGRKIDLLVQEAGDANGNVTIPDVNRMTENEARNVLEAGGVKVQAVDRVYSPLLPEGLAIETRPTAGTIIKAGGGVTLKLATQKRPAGFMDADSNNPNIRKVTSTQNGQEQQASQATAKTTQAKAQTPAEAIQQAARAGAQTAQTQTQQPSTQTPAPQRTTTQPVQTSTPSTAPAVPSGGTKTARIRYSVPPIAQPMNLRIEVTDPSGKRDVLNRQVNRGETVSTTAKYTNECVVTFYLGGEFVGQERYK